MEADLPVNASLTIPGVELRVSTSRSGGPGGQHVNTTDSRVTLRWNVAASTALTEPQRIRLHARLSSKLTLDGDLMVSVQDDRSQFYNRTLARERMAAMVAAALVEQKKRRPTRPSRASGERRLAAKRVRGARIRDRGGSED